MMLEQSLINPNFLGRDGFRWFIGQIPVGDSVKEGRAKVRILGHHPGDAQIKDKNLPWAHILVPLSFGSGAGNCGTNINVQPGTFVIGFFLDGDDGQQPVIIGALSDDDPSKIKVSEKYTEILNKGTSNFQPWYPPPPRNTWVQPTSTDKPAATGGTNVNGTTNTPTGPQGTQGPQTKEVTSKGQKLTTTEGITIVVPSECTNGNKKFNDLQLALIKFIQFTNTIQNINGAYINPVLNTVVNLDDQINSSARVITDIITGIIRGAMNVIVEEIYERLTDWLGIPGQPPVVKLATHKSVETVIDSIICAFEKALTKLLQFVLDFLMQMVEDVLAAPVCAVEALVGELLGGISNEIDDAIEDSLDEITSLIGGQISNVVSYVSQSVSLAQSALKFLSCEPSQCYETYNYELNKGWVPASSPNFQKILGYASATPVRNLSEDIKKSTNNWYDSVGLGTGQSRYSVEGGSCDAGILQCGSPTVSIFGGGGYGASANAIIDPSGKIFGYLINDSGSGYTSPPFVTIEDACYNGSGAVATALINDGKVQNIIVSNSGSGYIGTSDYVGIVSSFIITDTGIGYTSKDTITIKGTDVLANPILDQYGRITGIMVVNPGTEIKSSPIIEINTQSGQGANITPVLSFKPLSEVSPIKQKVQTVVYCAEDHV
jgi:hypothetical protein